MTNTQTISTTTKKRKAAVPAVSTKTKKAKTGSTSAGVEFNVVQASVTLSIPPAFGINLRPGAEEMLDSMLMRYIPAFEGVVLSHSNLQFLDKSATVIADCPFSICKVGLEATVWSPKIGMSLSGKINLSSPDHIALLVHKTFNVSIPRHHIPTDNYEFEYGPAENDPEFGADAEEKKEDEDETMEGDKKVEKPQPEGESGGRWIHKITGDKLGDKDGIVQFTVIGLTVANEMLSLGGSLQVDPFSTRHVAHATKTASKAKSRDVLEEPEEEDDDEDEEDSEAEEGNDAFDALKASQKDITLKKRKRAEKVVEEEAKPKKEKKKSKRSKKDMV